MTEKTNKSIDVESAKKRSLVKNIKNTSRKTSSRSAGQRISGFFRGLSDVTDADVRSAEKSAKRAKIKVSETKEKSKMLVWEEATSALISTLFNRNFSEEKKVKLAEELMKKALRETSK